MRGFAGHWSPSPGAVSSQKVRGRQRFSPHPSPPARLATRPNPRRRWHRAWRRTLPARSVRRQRESWRRFGSRTLRQSAPRFRGLPEGRIPCGSELPPGHPSRKGPRRPRPIPGLYSNWPFEQRRGESRLHRPIRQWDSLPVEGMRWMEGNRWLPAPVHRQNVRVQIGLLRIARSPRGTLRAAYERRKSTADRANAPKEWLRLPGSRVVRRTEPLGCQRDARTPGTR